MKWTLLLLTSFIPILCFPLEKEYEDRGIRVTFNIESHEEIGELANKIESLNHFLTGLFNYNINDKFSVVILPSVWHLTDRFGVNSLIGAVWVDDISFFQPLKNLKSMGKYEKTLFTEYSHHYVYSLSAGNIPYWFLEGISYILWLQYSGEKPFSGEEDYRITELKDFSTYMDEPAKLKNFYSSFFKFYSRNFNSNKELGEFISGLRYKEFEIEGS